MKITYIIVSIIMFVFVFLIKKFLKNPLIKLPSMLVMSITAFILLMIGLFQSSSSFKNVETKPVEEEEKEK